LRVLLFFAVIVAISVAVYSTVSFTANIAEDNNPSVLIQESFEEVQAATTEDLKISSDWE